MKTTHPEPHDRLTAIFSQLMHHAGDRRTWTYVQRECEKALDLELSTEQRLAGLAAAVAVFKRPGGGELALALEHHLLLQLDQTSRCPVVQDRLARLLLARDQVDIRPLSVGGQVLSHDLGTIAPADVQTRREVGQRSLIRGKLEYGPLAHWQRGLEFAEGLAVKGAGVMDAHQVIAGLTCLAMVILNLHCIADKKASGELAQHLYWTGPELWQRLHRKLARAQRERPNLAAKLASFSAQTYEALKLRLRSEVQHTAEEPATMVATHQDAPTTCEPESSGVRVLKEPIPPAAYKEDKEQISAYEALSNPMKPRCLAGVNDLFSRISLLRDEFPWATDAIDALGTALEPRLLLGRKEVRLPHLLLAGPPGSGKSRLARRIAAVFDLPFIPISVGGSTDVKMLLGTSRGWASGAPTPLLTSMLTHATPSGLVLLDELDKGADSLDGGRIVNAVLTFLERETASNYRDGYLHAACDLSWLSFIGTVNSLQLPKALLSRFRVVYVPEPGPEHRPALAAAMVSELAQQWDVPAEVLPPIPPALLATAGKSARDMRRCIEDYLAAWARVTLSPNALH